MCVLRLHTHGTQFFTPHLLHVFAIHVVLTHHASIHVCSGLAHPPRHRQFLRDTVVFKEVIPIADPAVKQRIHQTYNIGYIKDVVLPRVLDDQTFAAMSSLLLFYNHDVLTSLQAGTCR